MIKVKRDQILASDTATKLGFASYNDSGVWDFHKSEKPLVDMDSKFYYYIKEHDIKVIVMEDIFCDDNRQSAWKKLGEYRGVIRMLCEELNITIVFVPPTKIKYYATGNQYALKSQMVESCKRRYGITPIDDNEADAIHLYHYFVNNPTGYHVKIVD